MYDELLSPNTATNIDLLDECVQKMYRGDQQCHRVCEMFRLRPDSFRIVDQVLESSHSLQLKVYALNLFSSFVSTNWESLSSDNQIQLRNFIATYIYNVASLPDDQISKDDRNYLLRYSNIVLINVLKYEWPEKWENFIPDLLQAAGSSPIMCENSFLILRLLAQEFTEFAESSLSTTKQAEMSATFIEQHTLILPLIEMALSSTENSDLVNSALMCLKYLIKSIELSIIFNSSIFETICNTLLPDPRYMINCIDIFGEIAVISYLAKDMSQVILKLFSSIVECLTKVFGPNPIGIDMYDIGAKIIGQPNDFIHIFTISMSSFISSFQEILEDPNNSEPYSLMLYWLFNITAQSDKEDIEFKTCIELWHTITRTIFTECTIHQQSFSPVYNNLLPMLRRIAIQKMECPSELIYFFDENGVHSRLSESQTQSSVYFMNMREMLVYLTHINKEDMIAALFEKVDEIKRGNWSSEAMNSLCWAAGSIGGALTEEEEKHFVAQILDYLLALCKDLPDIVQRANVASGIMYICSQYAKFLSHYWNLLKVVMHKLFEFMRESIPEVQDSAIESMKQVVKVCHHMLAQQQPNEPSSFLVWMMNNSQQIFEPLRPDNIVEMYEIYSMIIDNVSDDDKKKMIEVISQNLNQQLEMLVNNIQPSDISWIEQFTFVINCNMKMARYLRYAYYSQLTRIIKLLLTLYTQSSEQAQRLLSIMNNNQSGIQSREFEVFQSVKIKICNLLTSSVQLYTRDNSIGDLIFDPSFDVLMVDYQNSPARTPEVLALFVALMSKYALKIKPKFSLLMNALYIPTLPYLTDDFSENFNFWKNFALFCYSIIQYIPSTLSDFSVDDIFTFINYLKRCCSHPQAEVSERAIQSLMDLVCSMETRISPSFAANFVNFFALDLFKHVFVLLTDNIHKYAFNLLIGLTRKLIQMNIFKTKQVDIFNIFTELFPYRPPSELSQAIEKMMEVSTNYFEFKQIIRNFLIQVRKYAIHDPALYEKDKEEIKKQIEEKLKVPGLIPPNEEPEVRENVQKLVDIVNNFQL